MSYWLLKSEPNVYSIEHLERDGSTLWEGVRNYQARNYLRQMQPGELALFYHSSVEPIGIAGVCRVVSAAEADPSQFDKKGEHFDPKSTPQQPRWFCPRVEFVARYPKLVTLDLLRKQRELAEMQLLKRGSRLSVQPVSPQEFKCIERMLQRME